MGGGYGNGSYYPWIYFQVALLLPMFAWLLKRCNRITSLVIFLAICEGFEILFSVTDFPDRVYRLLVIRYIFLIYLGWVWVKDGVRINWLTIFLSAISFVAIIYFEYLSVNDEPWFYKTRWSFHRWPCYIYVAYGLTAILHVLWKGLSKNDRIVKYIKILATSSYEIFLMQMTIRFFFMRSVMDFIQNKYIAYAAWFLMFWMLSIGGGIIMNRVLFSKKYRLKSNG